jgi:hypothetical protein
VAAKPVLGTNALTFDIGSLALQIAREEMSKLAGEEGENNSGPWVHKYTQGKDALWCAHFVSWCIANACDKVGKDRLLKHTGWARGLYKLAGKAGEFVDTPLPGDIACWKRGAVGGHVGIVSGVAVCGRIFWSIEGNRGNFPSRVDEFKHALGEDRLMGFARLPRL